MGVIQDIARAWRRPRNFIRGKLNAGPREDRALATVFGACALIFLAQWPALARAAHLNPEVPLDARMGGALLASLFIVPLIAYALAAVSHLAAHAIGGQGTWFSSRLALFWALLATTPVMLANGILAGFLGQGVPATAMGVLVLAGFLYLWVNMMIEAER